MENKYKFGQYLGKGAFGQVFLCTELATGIPVAIKKILKCDVKLYEYTKKEVKIMKSLNHKNVVKFIDVSEDNCFVYIVQEFCNGKDLEKYLKQQGRFNERNAAHIIRDICSGLFYLHLNNIIHRDLKPQNIMIKHKEKVNVHNFIKGENITFKIGDFGLSKQLIYSKYTSTACGTEGYCAPEVHLNQKNNYAITIYDNKVDIYSVGAITWNILTGLSINLLRISISKNFNDLNVNEITKDFLRKTLPDSTEQRLNIEQVCKHQFLTQLNHQDFELEKFQQFNIIHQLQKNIPQPQNVLQAPPPQNIIHAAPPQIIIHAPPPQNILHAPPQQNILHPPPQKNIIHSPPPQIIIHPPPQKNIQQQNFISPVVKTKFYDDGIYKGEMVNEIRHGNGKFYDNKGYFYNGQWKNDKKNGKGKYESKSGWSYKGDWKDDKMTGFGEFEFADGSYYKGFFLNGELNGEGIYISKDGNVTEGIWEKGKIKFVKN